VNLTYYPPQLSREFNLNLETFYFLQQVAFRLGKIKLFGGARYQIATTKVTFERILDIPGVDPWEIKKRLGGAGPVLFLDYRDHIFTPNQGLFLKGDYTYFATWLGGDLNFHMGSFNGNWYANP